MLKLTSEGVWYESESDLGMCPCDMFGGHIWSRWACHPLLGKSFQRFDKGKVGRDLCCFCQFLLILSTFAAFVNFRQFCQLLLLLSMFATVANWYLGKMRWDVFVQNMCVRHGNATLLGRSFQSLYKFWLCHSPNKAGRDLCSYCHSIFAAFAKWCLEKPWEDVFVWDGCGAWHDLLGTLADISCAGDKLSLVWKELTMPLLDRGVRSILICAVFATNCKICGPCWWESLFESCHIQFGPYSCIIGIQEMWFCIFSESRFMQKFCLACQHRTNILSTYYFIHIILMSHSVNVTSNLIWGYNA